MLSEPTVKRAAAFFDGQNLFYAAKHAFGYTWPNYDPLKLAKVICQQQGWQFSSAFFYTVIPSRQSPALRARRFTNWTISAWIPHKCQNQAVWLCLPVSLRLDSCSVHCAGGWFTWI